ncbi:hypothetical protein DFH07DRAFT_968253 [Mycena maculata]|uniref:Uncharacterized protein n=1 Tax=Mycena maculata TaxID=230809 RepID=A0AAD7MUQ3_9AGAR|nr:hypothetical protein DFH07DRAFT_968253 [Mycena maculata]
MLQHSKNVFLCGGTLGIISFLLDQRVPDPDPETGPCAQTPAYATPLHGFGCPCHTSANNVFMLRDMQVLALLLALLQRLQQQEKGKGALPFSLLPPSQLTCAARSVLRDRHCPDEHPFIPPRARSLLYTSDSSACCTSHEQNELISCTQAQAQEITPASSFALT